MPVWYRVSGIGCATIFGLFLGYLFSGIHQPVVQGYSPQGSNWGFWTVCVTAVLAAYTFVPKPVWLHQLNGLVLLLIACAIGVTGYLSSPTVADNLKGVALLSIFTLGGPLWLLVGAWIWHTATAAAVATPSA